jgi:hypothetical protein
MRGTVLCKRPTAGRRPNATCAFINRLWKSAPSATHRGTSSLQASGASRFARIVESLNFPLHLPTLVVATILLMALPRAHQNAGLVLGINSPNRETLRFSALPRARFFCPRLDPPVCERKDSHHSARDRARGDAASDPHGDLSRFWWRFAPRRDALKERHADPCRPQAPLRVGRHPRAKPCGVSGCSARPVDLVVCPS